MIVRIKKTDERLGVVAGEFYRAEPYWLDPTSKCSLLENLQTGKDGTCNQYWGEVEVVDGDKKAMVVAACRGYHERVDDFLKKLHERKS